MKKKLHGPVIFIDPKTGQATCDAEQCKKKFTISKYRIVQTNYKWSGGPVIHKSFQSLCNECSRSNATNKDKGLTGSSFRRGTLNAGVDPEITAEELQDFYNKGTK